MVFFRLFLLWLGYAKDYIGALILLVLSFFHLNATNPNALKSSVDWILANRVLKRTGLSGNVHQLIGLVMLLFTLYSIWVRFYTKSDNQFSDQYFNNFLPLVLIWVTIGLIVKTLMPRDPNDQSIVF